MAADYDSIEALLPLIGPWVQEVSQHELELVRLAEYTFRAQIADRWRDRNVFLLGDAAHLTPPFIGQGLCAGLRDAMNLSWKLAGVLSEDLPEGVLDSYEIERTPHWNTPSRSSSPLRREAHFLENVFFKGAWGSKFLFAMLEHEWRTRRESGTDSA